MAPERDTICALASGAAPSAIAIIRISGPKVRAVAKQVLKSNLRLPSVMALNTLIDGNGEEIDTGLCVFMAGPKSYTGEDTLELYLHGGRYIIDRALATLAEVGVRLAEPGEYTRRAFEAGKIDLTQAEAIADLISAETDAQHRLAKTQLDGALGELYKTWRDQLTHILALLEANIDFPDEEDAPDDILRPAMDRLTDLKVRLEDALSEGSITERIREGFHLVILGPPNAGKSTLLNRLARKPAAIVTDIPGTTRDIVEVRLEIGGFLVWVADTAGLRETNDTIEQIGIARARQAAEGADLRIWLHSADEDFSPGEDFRDGDLVVANKTDIFNQKTVSRETTYISANTGAGIDLLLQQIASRLSEHATRLQAPSLTRARHRQAISIALSQVETALDRLNSGFGIELVAEEVRLAARAVAGLTGHIETESILGAVFASFCIGK